MDCENELQYCYMLDLTKDADEILTGVKERKDEVTGVVQAAKSYFIQANNIMQLRLKKMREAGRRSFWKKLDLEKKR
jgi:hypothetical protein